MEGTTEDRGHADDRETPRRVAGSGWPGRADGPEVMAGDDGATGVLLPVKAFHLAKVRLAAALGPAARVDLARSMATTVVHAAAPLAVHVVCDDDRVAEWASEQGATVLWRPGHGLNAAVRSGVDALAAGGYTRVIVAHADLPHATDLASLAAPDGITLVPDRHDDGTNVIVLPSDVPFTFGYGPASFLRHLAEAERTGLPVRIDRRPRLGWDVDEPADLIAPEWATP